MSNTQGWTSIALYFGLFLVLFYVLVVMPRKKQEKRHKTMLEELKRGDRIITIGGIKGQISQVKDDVIVLKVSENTEIEIIKRAVAMRDEEK